LFAAISTAWNGFPRAVTKGDGGTASQDPAPQPSESGDIAIKRCAPHEPEITPPQKPKSTPKTTLNSPPQRQAKTSPLITAPAEPVKVWPAIAVGERRDPICFDSVTSACFADDDDDVKKSSNSTEPDQYTTDSSIDGDTPLDHGSIQQEYSSYSSSSEEPVDDIKWDLSSEQRKDSSNSDTAKKLDGDALLEAVDSEREVCLGGGAAEEFTDDEDKFTDDEDKLTDDEDKLTGDEEEFADDED
jgi:hypothetical protein